MHVRQILLLILFVTAASGCTSPSPTSLPSPQPIIMTSTPLPANTAQPTYTEEPTGTALPSLEPTAVQTAEPSVTPTSELNAALEETELIGLSWLEGYELLLSFQFPGPVDPSDYRVTLEDKEYSCEIVANMVDRLYCIGQGAKVLAVATVRVYPAGSSTPGFEKKVWVPYFDNDYNTFNP
jgi:hypothetical protein